MVHITVPKKLEQIFRPLLAKVDGHKIKDIHIPPPKLHAVIRAKFKSIAGSFFESRKISKICI
jgi:hypothetical protein